MDGQIATPEVGQRELEMLDIKTANRDKKIWEVAHGGSQNFAAVDDSNIPPPLVVKTNKPGVLEVEGAPLSERRRSHQQDDRAPGK